MSNHGAVTHGADVDAAVRTSELLEWAAGVYWRASIVGEPRVLDPDQLQAVIEAAVSRGYGATKPLERAS